MKILFRKSWAKNTGIAVVCLLSIFAIIMLMNSFELSNSKENTYNKPNVKKSSFNDNQNPIELSFLTENTLPPGCDYSKSAIDLTKHYDWCIVGAGLSGTVFAERASKLDESVLVIDYRPHIGGNCYDLIDQKTGVLRNQYGSHLFHTKIEVVWNYINNPKSPPWKAWYHMKYGLINGTYVPIPVNIMTVNRLFNLIFKPKKKWISGLGRYKYLAQIMNAKMGRIWQSLGWERSFTKPYSKHIPSNNGGRVQKKWKHLLQLEFL